MHCPPPPCGPPYLASALSSEGSTALKKGESTATRRTKHTFVERTLDCGDVDVELVGAARLDGAGRVVGVVVGGAGAGGPGPRQAPGQDAPPGPARVNMQLRI